MPGLYSITTRASGTVLTASIYNSDHQNHVDNQTPQATDDYSVSVVQMRTMTDPGEVGTESLPTALSGELERLRWMIAEITGKTNWYETPAQNLTGTIPAGAVLPWPTSIVPLGYLACNGVTFLRASQPALDAALRKTSTVTITIASPGVVSWVAHGLQRSDPIKFTTTGALPTGITAGTTYYLAGTVNANQFSLATAPNGAVINTSGTQSGTHTAIYAPWGDGDGVTTTNTPDLRGRVWAGHDTMQNAGAGRLTFAVSGIFSDSPGATGGSQDPQIHTHGVTDPLHAHGGTTGAGGAHTHDVEDATGSLLYDDATHAGVKRNANPGIGADAIANPSQAWKTNDPGNHLHAIPAGATGITVNNALTGTTGNVQPTAIGYWIIKT